MAMAVRTLGDDGIVRVEPVRIVEGLIGQFLVAVLVIGDGRHEQALRQAGIGGRSREDGLEAFGGFALLQQVAAAGDVADAEGGIEGQGLVDQRPRLLDPALVEQQDRQIGIGDGAARIGFDGAAQGLLGGERPVAIGLEQAEAVPDIGVARRDGGGPAQGLDGRVHLAVDVAADIAVGGDHLRIVRIDGLGPGDGLAHLLAPVEDIGDLRRHHRDALIVRKTLLRAFQHLRRSFQILAEGHHIGMGEHREGLVLREFRLRIDPLRIGQGLGHVAPVGREDAPLRIETPFGPGEQGRRLGPAMLRAEESGLDEIGAGALRWRSGAGCGPGRGRPRRPRGRRGREPPRRGRANPPRCAPAAGSTTIRLRSLREARPVSGDVEMEEKVSRRLM